MLLPYYIASMNIEHAYFERTGEYMAFPGICLVDTFELAEAEQSGFSFMTEENAERVKRQKTSPIFVVVGNPPYNAWQVDESDNNKNRKYPTLDKRISNTYRKDSKAGLTIAVNDPYVKAIRWASDRIGVEGVVAFVTNSSFIDQGAFDSMRKCLGEDFTSVYVLDLGGNVRRNPKLAGTTHNVFGIQVGVSINLLVRRNGLTGEAHSIWYARVDEWWKRQQKYNYLDTVGDKSGVDWSRIVPDARFNWLTAGMRSEFDSFLPLGDKEGRSRDQVQSMFDIFSNGVKTNRDAWVYNFSCSELEKNVELTVTTYNDNVLRWRHAGLRPTDLDAFVTADETKIGWSGDMKSAVLAGEIGVFAPGHVRTALYRPFTIKRLYFDRLLNNSIYRLPIIFPTEQTEAENRLICLTGPGSEKPFLTLAAASLIDLHLSGAGCTTQCFPFYTYADDGTHRRENITDWALEQFRVHYHDPSISKWDIFYYVYAVLHHPEYRERYAANLRRELPRIPFASATTACHPDEAESSASPRTPEEGPMQLTSGSPAAKAGGPGPYSR
jgi:predicted helicase